MIEFTQFNPRCVDVHRDGARIGSLTKNKDGTWSGLVDGKHFKGADLSTVKQHIHDTVPDRLAFEVTGTGLVALSTRRSRENILVRNAAARGVTELQDITDHFRVARRLADDGDTVKAAAALAPLKDALLGVLDTLDQAGVLGQTEKQS